ncbi:S-phase kinase-associated protein 1 [Ditylenchus destructor]|nr:S-phase kinase-associated protein 1 [Ditylenchus destructor]
MTSDVAPTESNENGSPKQKTIRCRTRDGVLFEVSVDVISHAGTFKQMCSDLQLGADGAVTFEFPMPGVNATVFEQLVKFCKQRIGVPEPVIEREPPSYKVKMFELSKFETDFLGTKSTGELKELWLAARYLDIKSLDLFIAQEIATRLIAAVGDDKKVREIVNGPVSVSEKEQNKIREDNMWLKYV